MNASGPLGSSRVMKPIAVERRTKDPQTRCLSAVMRIFDQTGMNITPEAKKVIMIYGICSLNPMYSV